SSLSQSSLSQSSLSQSSLSLSLSHSLSRSSPSMALSQPDLSYLDIKDVPIFNKTYGCMCEGECVNVFIRKHSGICYPFSKASSLNKEKTLKFIVETSIEPRCKKYSVNGLPLSHCHGFYAFRDATLFY